MHLQKTTKSGASGYRLRYVPETDLYQIHSEHGAFEGPLVQIWQKMVWEYEFENKEIRMALDEMMKNDHDVANFGIFKSFIFTQEK